MWRSGNQPSLPDKEEMEDTDSIIVYIRCASSLYLCFLK